LYNSALSVGNFKDFKSTGVFSINGRNYSISNYSGKVPTASLSGFFDKENKIKTLRVLISLGVIKVCLQKDDKDPLEVSTKFLFEDCQNH
jgi:hypothetical protein